MFNILSITPYFCLLYQTLTKNVIVLYHTHLSTYIGEKSNRKNNILGKEKLTEYSSKN